MTVRDRRRELALRRILEGVIATVAGGLILWSVTNSMSQPAPQARIIAAAPAVESRAAPAPASPAAEEPMPRAAARVPVPAFIPAPTAELPPPKCSLLPYFAPLPAGPVLLYEDFSDCREGETPGWGPNTFIKTGLDRRHWLVSNVEGPHPVGCRIPLPDRFSFQCRYSAYLPELTRGILYWWKEPVATKVSFLNDQGGPVGHRVGDQVRERSDAAQSARIAVRFRQKFIMPLSCLTGHRMRSLSPSRPASCRLTWTTAR